ncbi:hypothetical protein EV182_003106 [Spiromyces aspiralis]|uniref:Uncharacterized protein n=1 Tax=Spiromyces aspiralis TaxID=68401 RepID=A0ACC1HJP8_9FUNG|nr:hypothetical protein EV182_003106 [Spiromyces aspiralis]
MVHVSIPTVPATEIRASADLAAQSTTTPGGLHNASGDYSLDLALSRDSNRSSIMAEELMLANGGSTTDAPCPGGAISRVSSGKKLVISHIDIDAANRPQQQHKTECASYSAHDKSGGEQISDSRTVSIDDALSPLPEPKVLTQQRKIDKLSRFFGNPLDSSILATQCPDQASDCSMALPVNSSDAPGTYSTRIEKSTSNPGFGDRLSVPGKPSDHRSTTHFLRFQSISKGFRKSSKSFRLTLAPGLRGQKSQQRQQQVTAPSHAELRHTGTSPRWRLGMGNRMTRRAASPRVASDGSGKMGCYDTNWKDGCINNEKSAVRGTTRGNSGNWSCDNDMAATESMGMTPPSSSLSMSPGMRRTAPHTNKALPPLPNSAATTAHSTSTMNELPPITISKSSHIYTSCESEESVVVSSAKIVTAIPQLTTLSEANLFSEFTLLDEGSQPGTANTISASFAASLADFATRMPINVTDHASS